VIEHSYQTSVSQNPPAGKPGAAARLGGYFAAAVARAKGTELEIAIARVIGATLATDRGTGVYVSTEQLQARCLAYGAASTAWYGTEPHAPAYGTVVGVLEMLGRIGVLAWGKAHVHRWCSRPLFKGAKSPRCACEWEPIRPRRHASGTWRLPARCLRVVGWAQSMLHAWRCSPCAPAPRADSIDTAERQRPSETEFVPLKSGTPSPREHSTTAPSIEAAPTAHGSALDLSGISGWRPPPV